MHPMFLGEEMKQQELRKLEQEREEIRKRRQAGHESTTASDDALCLGLVASMRSKQNGSKQCARR